MGQLSKRASDTPANLTAHCDLPRQENRLWAISACGRVWSPQAPPDRTVTDNRARDDVKLGIAYEMGCGLTLACEIFGVYYKMGSEYRTRLQYQVDFLRDNDRI
jgi:hypothetical protein